MNSVSFMSSRVVSNNNQAQKKSNYGAKIGAGVGFAAGAARVFQKRGAVNAICEEMIAGGASRGMVMASKALGIAGILAITVGVGALVGKGVEKVVNHFKKSGKSEAPSSEAKDPFAPRTVKTKKDGEFVIEPGHPKKIYKKNPETGELDFVTEVYDGSWGKEASDEDLIKILTKKVK